ncbi:hypothetical protein [Micromonospora sp. WMMD1082]|uniref:hypothetical protein n=1 Tax=Micromonospora sp. WMMD1082 TaxID=3016104 RepID=UPI002416F9B9|nr:hypothetical protein [Micromonospora sp. WMMD1082]MDG4794454.1 hypothetical protein [Micromonospora sp. WMMD1082]
MAKKRDTPYRSLTTHRYVLVAAAVFVLGAYFLYLGGEETRFWQSHPGLRTLMEQLGGLLIVTAGISILWELIGKRSFAREVLESTRTANEIESAGLKRITNQFYDEALWKYCFKGVEKLDIFVAYGGTWRRTYLSQLQTLAKSAKGRIRVYLADPEDPATITTLANRFGSTPEKLKEKIWETKEEFEALQQEGGASVQVFFWAGDRVFTFYRFDNRAVVALYQHSEGRSPVLPTIQCENGGSLFQFVYDELRSIRTASRPATQQDEDDISAVVTQIRRG